MAEDSKATESAKGKTPSGSYAGTEIKIDGEDHIIIREDEVPVATDTE
ncbi:hypothetical protein ACFVXG_39415 [Kitasatospora sp. NPDC058162]